MINMLKMSTAEMLTYSTVLIRCEYSNGTTGSGTGFIINLCHDKESGKCVPVIVTNNHVVENSVKTVFEFCKADSEGNPIDTEPFLFTYNGNSWMHHPDANVDLRCLFLAEALNKLQENHIRVFFIPLETNLIPSSEVLESLSAIEDVVMVGYPIGLSDRYNHKPIVRRGITASHPRKDYQGKKETLLDMACFPGSSGSPVFILNQGSFTTPKGISFGNRVYLLGILYGGPQYNATGVLQFASLPNVPVPVTSLPTNLGVMIKSERLLEFENQIKMINGGNA